MRPKKQIIVTIFFYETLALDSILNANNVWQS
jgi:hypothetical protein